MNYSRYAGGFSASLSSAIASLVGAPRVLQAVGKDKLYPGVFFFAHGYTANNDPYRGYILVFVVALGFAMLAKLNTVSVVASNFFLAAYALMNLSCFHSSMTKAPSWRPAYKFYNPWVAGFSVILCLVIMFLLDALVAAITILVSNITLFAIMELVASLYVSPHLVNNFYYAIAISFTMKILKFGHNFI